jgi:PAS domain S-box-containing protein
LGTNGTEPALGHVPIGIAVTTLEGRVLQLNPAFCSSLGCSQRELLAGSLDSLVHADDLEDYLGWLDRVRSGNMPGEALRVRFLRRDGSAFWAESSALMACDKTGAPTKVVMVVQDVSLQRRAEEALRNSEDRHRRLVETARELIATVDLNGRFTSLNAGFEAMTGWGRELWIGRSFSELVHPEDIAACLKVFEAARRGDVPPSLTHRIATRGGEWLTLESTGTPVYQDGRVDGVMGIGRDVTARIATEAALRESRLRLHALFENALDAILLWDDAGRYVDANPAAAELLGYSREELTNLSASDVTPAGDRENMLALRRTFDAVGGSSGEYRLKRKDGSVRDAEFRAVANILPGLHLAVVRDVTDRKRVERELLSRERLFEEAEKAAHVGSWEWDVASGALVWSAETYRIFGVAQGRFVPTYARFLERVHSGDRSRVSQASERAARHGGDFGFEFRILRPSRELRFLQTRGLVLRDHAGGAALRVVGIVQDVTERRRDEKLRRDLLTRLLAAHEDAQGRLSRELHDGAGQSLTAVLVGLRRLEDAASLKEAKALAARQRGVVAAIIEELGRLARGLRPAALDDLGLRGALQRYAIEGERLFGLEITLRCRRVSALPREVETALFRTVQEAVSNAARHGSASGVRISLERDGGGLRLDVTDDGCGFDTSRIRRAPGHLGLSGIRERAALLGGRAEIVSHPGRGTRVAVSLPLPAPARPPRAAARSRSVPARQASR